MLRDRNNNNECCPGRWLAAAKLRLGAAGGELLETGCTSSHFREGGDQPLQGCLAHQAEGVRGIAQRQRGHLNKSPSLCPHQLAAGAPSGSQRLAEKSRFSSSSPSPQNGAVPQGLAAPAACGRGWQGNAFLILSLAPVPPRVAAGPGQPGHRWAHRAGLPSHLGLARLRSPRFMAAVTFCSPLCHLPAGL